MPVFIHFFSRDLFERVCMYARSSSGFTFFYAPLLHCKLFNTHVPYELGTRNYGLYSLFSRALLEVDCSLSEVARSGQP